MTTPTTKLTIRNEREKVMDVEYEMTFSNGESITLRLQVSKGHAALPLRDLQRSLVHRMADIAAGMLAEQPSKE